MADDSRPDGDPHERDPFGRAIRDFRRGEQDEPLLQCGDGRAREHPVERFYFTPFEPEDEDAPDGQAWLRDRLDLDGPLLDLGAGAGRHARHFQDLTDTVAVEVSGHLVRTMRERGVEGARRGDMFELPEAFGRDRFRSALAHGTQLGLAGSMRGLRTFLGDLAHVTDEEGRAVLDCYDPARAGTRDLLGYRHDPTPGLAYRVMHFAYEGDVGPTLLFRLFAPDRLREACVGTGWTVTEVRRGAEGNAHHYHAVLAKR